MQRIHSVEKTLILGKIEDTRSGRQRMRWLDGITDWMGEFEQILGDGEGQGSLGCCNPWGSQRIRHDLATELQNSAHREPEGLRIRCSGLLHREQSAVPQPHAPSFPLP